MGIKTAIQFERSEFFENEFLPLWSWRVFIIPHGN